MGPLPGFAVPGARQAGVRTSLKGAWEEQATQEGTGGGGGVGGRRGSRQRGGWGGPRKVPPWGAQGPGGMMMIRLRGRQGSSHRDGLLFRASERRFLC